MLTVVLIQCRGAFISDNHFFDIKNGRIIFLTVLSIVLSKIFPSL